MARNYSVFITEYTTDVRLGSLAFDEENNVTLTLIDTGPKFDLLKQRWDEAKDLPTLKVTRIRREKDDNGGWVRRNLVEEIAKESSNYPSAVVQYLGTNFGYSMYTLPVTGD